MTNPSGLTLFWVALFTSAFSGPFVFAILRRMRSRQSIYEHAPETHQVKQGTPTMGGLMILIGVLAAWAYQFLFVVAQEPIGGFVPPGMGWCLATVLIGFAGIGFVDDYLVPKMTGTKRGLGWKQKITLQVLVAVGAALLIVPVEEPLKLSCLVFLVLFCANAFNFLDGLDALSGSTLLCLLFGVFALGAGEPGVSFLCLSLAGATIPFLFVNAPPAKVFMGDVGALPIGALLGLAFYWLAAPTTTALRVSPWALLVLGFILIAELVPVPLQVGFFKLTGKRLFPFTPIHHAFEKKGWKETRVVWSFALMQIVLSMAAIEIASRVWSQPR